MTSEDYDQMMAVRHGTGFASASPAPAGDLVERWTKILDAAYDDYQRGAASPDDDLTTFMAKRVIAAMQPGWRDMKSAPKDGTPILAWCVHPHARYAGDDKEWAAPVVTQWITHNGGGWTWNGIAGSFTHWQPLPAPPGVGG